MKTEIGFVAVELSDSDALLFKQFCQYHDKFQFLVQNGVFDLKRGFVTINFSNEGNISSIQKSEYIYPNQCGQKY